MNTRMSVDTNGDWTVVTVAGAVDVHSAPRLREQLLDVCAAGVTRIVVDFDGVDFVDSVGMGVLVGAHKRCSASGGDLRLVATGQAVLRVLRVTGLHRLLPAHGSVADAIAGRPAALSS